MRTDPLHPAASAYYLFFGGLFPTVRSLLFPATPRATWRWTG
jgi:hypothetical protein